MWHEIAIWGEGVKADPFQMPGSRARSDMIRGKYNVRCRFGFAPKKQQLFVFSFYFEKVIKSYIKYS